MGHTTRANRADNLTKKEGVIKIGKWIITLIVNP